MKIPILSSCFKKSGQAFLKIFKFTLNYFFIIPIIEDNECKWKARYAMGRENNSSLFMRIHYERNYDNKTGCRVSEGKSPFNI